MAAVAVGHLVGRLNLERDQLQLDTCGLALNQSINPWTVFNQPCLTNLYYTVLPERWLYTDGQELTIPIQIFTAHACTRNAYMLISSHPSKKKELPVCTRELAHAQLSTVYQLGPYFSVLEGL